MMTEVYCQLGTEGIMTLIEAQENNESQVKQSINKLKDILDCDDIQKGLSIHILNKSLGQLSQTQISA